MSCALMALIIVAIAAGGCTTTDGLASSVAPAEIPSQAASAMAGDMVSRLAEQMGPGTATVVLKRDSSTFGEAVEAALKSWGYAVIIDQKPDTSTKIVSLAYAVEPFEGGFLARLSTGSIEIGRAYRLTPTGAVPASPVSVMQRG